MRQPTSRSVARVPEPAVASGAEQPARRSAEAGETSEVRRITVVSGQTASGRVAGEPAPSGYAVAVERALTGGQWGPPVSHLASSDPPLASGPVATPVAAAGSARQLATNVVGMSGLPLPLLEIMAWWDEARRAPSPASGRSWPPPPEVLSVPPSAVVTLVLPDPVQVLDRRVPPLRESSRLRP